MPIIGAQQRSIRVEPPPSYHAPQLCPEPVLLRCRLALTVALPVAAAPGRSRSGVFGVAARSVTGRRAVLSPPRSIDASSGARRLPTGAVRRGPEPGERERESWLRQQRRGLSRSAGDDRPGDDRLSAFVPRSDKQLVLLLSCTAFVLASINLLLCSLYFKLVGLAQN